MRRLFAYLLLAAILPSVSSAEDVLRARGRLIAGLRDISGAQIVLNRPHSLTLMPEIGAAVIEFDAEDEARVQSELENNSQLQFLEPSFYVRVPSVGATQVRQAASAPTDDPLADLQWPLRRLRANAAWEISPGSPRVRVAVLDTGIDQDHPDLSPAIETNVNFSDSLSFDDFYGHGTHVGGIIAAVANNGLGVAGTASGVTLLNVKVAADDGWADLSWIARGIVWAVNHGAQVINISMTSPLPSKLVERAVLFAARKGVIVCASSGNETSDAPQYPAAYLHVIAVAGTDHRDRKMSMSNYGANWVDVAAPGEAIFSTGPNHPNAYGLQEYGLLSGTSMASAYVAAEAALIFSKHAGEHPSSKMHNFVRTRIERTTDKVRGSRKLYRHGRINLQKALSFRP